MQNVFGRGHEKRGLLFPCQSEKKKSEGKIECCRTVVMCCVTSLKNSVGVCARSAEPAPWQPASVVTHLKAVFGELLPTTYCAFKM